MLNRYAFERCGWFQHAHESRKGCATPHTCLYTHDISEMMFSLVLSLAMVLDYCTSIFLFSSRLSLLINTSDDGAREKRDQQEDKGLS